MVEAVAHLEIVGPGRAGLTLGSLLLEIGGVGRLSYSGRSPSPPDHPLFRGSTPSASYRQTTSSRGDAPDAVLLAVPDGAITAAAAELETGGLLPSTPVLHLSGALGSDALEPLARRGFPTGSMHPLAALPDAGAGAVLRGAWFALEGAPAAVRIAERLVAAMEGRPLFLAAEGKALYHAGAVAASNFVVALLAVAERWLTTAGVPPAEARAALTALAEGAVATVRRLGPEDALTGPVSRGDADTVRRHLERLSPPDRLLYSVLASSTLALARQRGLEADAAAELARLLEPIE